MEGVPLSGIETQSEKYGAGLPAALPAWHKPLPFLYESTGVETFFTNGLDPDPRSRRTFGFHRPETLAEWARPAAGPNHPAKAMDGGDGHRGAMGVDDVQRGGVGDSARNIKDVQRGGVGDSARNSDDVQRGGVQSQRDAAQLNAPTSEINDGAMNAPVTLRGRLRRMPALNTAGLWSAQVEAVANLDLFWLRDESLEDSANLPEPDVLAAEIVEDLRAALEQFATIAEELGE